MANETQPNAKEVFSAKNISQTISDPAAPPDLTDPLALRGSLSASLGLGGLRQAETEAATALTEARAESREQQAALKQLPRESLGFIGKARSRAAEESAIRQQAAAETLGVAQTARLAGENQLNIQFDILNRERERTLDFAFKFPGANIKLGDSPDAIRGKLKKFEINEEKRLRKQAQKDAFDDLFFNAFGKDRGKLSRREAKRKLRKKMKGKENFENKLQRLQVEKEELGLQKLRQSMAEAQPQEINISSFFDEPTATTQGGGQPGAGAFDPTPAFNSYGL